MKKNNCIRIILFTTLAGLMIVACQRNNVNLNQNTYTPQSIILRQKDSAGKFELIYGLKLFPNKDSIYFDSLQITSPNGQEPSVVFNHSKFPTKNYLSIRYNDNYVGLGTEIILFANRNILNYHLAYDTINDIDVGGFRAIPEIAPNGYLLYITQPVENSSSGTSVRFEYIPDSSNATKMNAFVTANQAAEDSFYTATFYDIPNKSNLMDLSGVGNKHDYGFWFNLGSFNYRSFEGLFCMYKLPFRGFNMKLVKSIRYTSNDFMKDVT